MSPFWDPPKNENGVTIDPGFYTVDGELFDRSNPTPAQIDYMVEHDSQAQALDLAISLILQSAPIDIEPAPGDKGEAKFVREALFSSHLEGGMTTPIHEVLAQMDDAISRKRVYFELVWKSRPDGKAVFHKVAWRPPWMCTMKVDPKNGSFDGFEQRWSSREHGLIKKHFKPKDRKAFVYIFRNHKRPLEGYSIFQTAFGDYEEKLKANRLHNIHLQKFALGTIVGRYAGRLKGAARKFFDKLKDWRGGGGVIVLGDSEEVRIETHTGAGAEFLEKIRYLDSQMAGSVLLGFLLLANPGNSGAWALSRDHRDFFLMLMEAINKDKAQAGTNYLVAPLVEANFGENAAFPKMTIGALSEDKKQFAAEVYKALVVAANRPQGAEWDAIREQALPMLGIDLEKLQKAIEEEEKEAQETEGAGDKALTPEEAEQLKQSMQRLLKPGEEGVATNGASTNGASTNGASTNGATPNGSGS